MAEVLMPRVLMPQIGESVAEGTILRWLKNVGDVVERDDTLLEISTDKVDTQILSPESGVLMEIRFQAGASVEVNTVIAFVGQAAEYRAWASGLFLLPSADIPGSMSLSPEVASMASGFIEPVGCEPDQVAIADHQPTAGRDPVRGKRANAV